MELKPQAQPRPYQEKSLSKMFGNGWFSLLHGVCIFFFFFGLLVIELIEVISTPYFTRVYFFLEQNFFKKRIFWFILDCLLVSKYDEKFKATILAQI